MGQRIRKLLLQSFGGDKCKKCGNDLCYVKHFEQNFDYWTSDNYDIDEFIKDTQLSAHNNISKASEWIPYNRFDDIKYISENRYEANWIDGYIYGWDNKNRNWKRFNQDMLVTLKSLNNPKDVTSEFTMNKVKFHGITQNPQTKVYMMVLSDKCKKCNCICYAIHFQQNFIKWTSGNDNIDKFIQNTQLSIHKFYELSNALEWIPYNRFNNIKYIKINMLGRVFKANWIDGYINRWDNDDQNWIRSDKNMIVILKILEINTIEFINTIKQEKYEFYGISQEPQTKNYMMVLSGKCMKRNRVNIRVKYCQEDFDDWTSYECKKCNHVCNASYFQKNFENWTSGNDDINRLIQDTQLSVHYQYEILNALEWIPYNRFYDIKYIARGGFGKVYKANWIDGRIVRWDNENKNWERSGNKFVALKSLNNSSNATFEFMNEISLHHRGSEDNAFIVGFYGITQHPETKNYIMVLDYAEDGSLRDYLDKTYNKLDWDGKIGHLHDITLGLTCIHEKRLIHRDLHIGNILKLKSNIAITDMGLCKPADYNQLKNAKNNVYGILPYIAPEILRGGNYTKAADIYSLGIIIYEMISGFPPYYDLSHDNNLAIKICQGLRPKFNIKVPQLIVHLIKRCLDSNPLDRPKAGEIEDILYKWKYLSYKTHSEAIYTSRLFDFNNLPEPKNSDDYYKHADNIISLEFSASLQIDISQLNIN
ncbi:hypothetical protein RclHR1_10410006 [Rhizophagus clarus]|uniref:Protein kinase domain-containing protein n=1 Tax=Rhizophagus clarus TaxID=94130 RepID=A0A2Z6QTV4_9GLOM|nr:hypothetical protein RclHR1_10410006 [Rhizophagus clarus]